MLVNGIRCAIGTPAAPKPLTLETTGTIKWVGTVVWPYPLPPHATTLPSDLRASTWSHPAETATTFDRPAGTLVWPTLSLPQAATVPSDWRATAKSLPAEIAVMLDRPVTNCAQ